MVQRLYQCILASDFDRRTMVSNVKCIDGRKILIRSVIGVCRRLETYAKNVVYRQGIYKK